MSSAITPTKRRSSSRSYSSSSLFQPTNSKHVRRPSKSTSLSHSHSTTVLFPLPPVSPTTSYSSSRKHHPLSIPRIVSVVDNLLPRRLRRARLSAVHADRNVIIALICLFLFVFILLFLLLRYLLPSTDNSYDLFIQNLKRVEAGRPPRQIWPSNRAREKSLYQHIHPKKPILSSLDISNVVSRRLASNSPKKFISISIVAACRDRSAFLQTALPKWLELLPQDAEIILIDWGTLPPDHIPLDVIAKAAIDSRITVASVSSNLDWVLSHAYNLGFSLAAGQWILKLDCDTQLHDQFFETHLLDSQTLISKASATKDNNMDIQSSQLRARELLKSNDDVNPPVFYRSFWENARDENEQHLAGIFLARREDINRIYGYDERIITYGWDDSDIYSRLEASGFSEDIGLIPIPIDLNTIHHMRHGDDLRGANQRLVSGPTLETQINAQATEILPSWSKVGAQEKSKYTFDLLSRNARFLRATTSNSPRPLLQQLSTTDRQRIITEATNRVLHDTYGFPWGVLSEINRSRQELVRSLAALGRSTHWRSASGFIFAEVGGTVPDRVLAVVSAVALAIKYDRPLFLAWSSGSRADPTPRIMDFFNVEASLGETHTDFRIPFHGSAKAKIYQVGRWRCRSVLDVCSQHDPAYSMMAEFRSGERSDKINAARAIFDVLEGKVPGKRNVLLRLEGSLPLQTMREKSIALASLHPSVTVDEQIRLLGNQSSRMGIYVGQSLSERSIEAMTKRVKALHPPETKYFITGATRDIVKKTRISLESDDFPEVDTQSAGLGSAREVRETRRDIAEIYALASCQGMVNDGRPSLSVLDFVDILVHSRSLEKR